MEKNEGISRLSIYLPPFAGDYSGVCSALFELNCLVVIDDAACCTRNYINCDEPRWSGSKKTTFSSRLRTIEAVLGDEERLISQTVDAAQQLKPDFTAVISTPVPAIIGRDMAGIAREIEARSGIPAFGFDTTGFQYYDKGVSAAILALVRRFAAANAGSEPGSVNILGLTPLDFSANDNGRLLRRFLEENGFTVRCSFLMETSLDQVRHSSSAQVNLAVSQSGLAAAEYMRERFDIPYVAAMPLGTKFSQTVIAALKGAGKDKQNLLNTPGRDVSGEKILIIGDQVMANSIRTALYQKDCQATVTAASFFTMNPELMAPGDVPLESERQLLELLKSGLYQVLIADPLICQVPAAAALKRYTLPHPAVSGPLHWDDVPLFVGEGFEKTIESWILKKTKKEGVMHMSETMDFTTTRAEALELLCKNWPLKAETEIIPLQQACGRVTAKPVYSRNTLPVHRVSSFDGIAVKYSAFKNGLPDTSGWVEGVDYVRADTGDDFPDEFDTIVAVEDFYYNDAGHICFYEDVDYERGDCIRAAGTVVREGDVVAEAHVRLTPEHLAMLALGGIYQVEVIKKPKVVYIPTGSELITAGIKPERGQNIEANGLMVASYLTQWGADPFCYPIVKDKPAELEQALKNALLAGDIVLINGGSSKGAEDYNTALLQKNAAVYRHGIKVVPGRPVSIAIIDGKPVINLSGPTLATYLAMDWCVYGLVQHYYGLPMPVRPRLPVRLEKPVEKNPEFEMYLRFSLTKREGIYWASQIGRDKNLPDSMLKAHALFVAPIGVAGYEAGDEIEVELLCGLENIR